MITLFLLFIIVAFFSACCAIDHKSDVESANVYYRMQERRNRKK